MRNFIFLVLLSVMCSVTSCQKDDIEQDIPVADEFNSSVNTTTTNYEQIIKKCVSVSYSYKDYLIYTKFNSSLASALPNKTIKYGIEFGYSGEYAYEQFCNDFSGEQGSIASTLFFSCGTYDFSSEDLYAQSYRTLQERIAKGEKLCKEEEQALYSFLKYLNRAEPTAKKEYVGRSFVEINDNRYYINKVSL